MTDHACEPAAHQVRRRLGALLMIAVLTVTGCAASDSQTADEPPAPAPSSTSASPTPSPTSTPTTTPSKTRQPRQGTEVIVDDSDFGPMLYGADGQAIYLFDLEDSAQPRCYDDCADAWPPVLTDGKPVAGRGAAAGLLGTTQRDDGSTQVTYAGHPLYFYAHEDPWQVLCHDFFDYGGTWYVVTPGGDAAA